MFCPQCDSEYQEGYTRCADCDVALVEELPPEPRGTAEMELEQVYETTDPTLLPVIKSVLESAGIPYMLEGEGSFAMLPLGGGFVNERHQALGVEIHVARERAEEARALLASAAAGAGPVEPADQEAGENADGEE